MTAVRDGLHDDPPIRFIYPQGVSYRIGWKRRSRSALSTTETLENAIAAPAIIGLSRPDRGERDRGDVVAERPGQVLLDRAQRRAATAGSRRRRRAGRRRRASGPTASIATSVPVPIARPRSAWASAGASLTPSPTIATTRPSACSRRTTSALSGGQHLGDHLVDADLGGDGARGRLVVAGQQHRPQPERPQRGDGLGGRRLDGVGDDEQRAGRAVPAGGDRRSARGLGAARARRRAPAAAASPSSASSDGRPTTTRVPVDDALDAEALAVRRSPRRRAAAPSPARGARRSPGRSGARRRARARRRAAAPRRGRRPSATTTSTSAHPAGRDGAGLVEHDRVDLARGLEDLGALDQQAELRAAAGADQQRRRRREPERARAGDDQHGDGGGEREASRPRRRRARSASVATARRDHDRHEDRRRPGRRAAAPAPCRSARRRRAGRSARARCRRRRASRGRPGARRR